MMTNERIKKIQEELELYNGRADLCIESDRAYFDEVGEIYFKLVDISFQKGIPKELKKRASKMAEHLSTKYGSIHL